MGFKRPVGGQKPFRDVSENDSCPSEPSQGTKVATAKDSLLTQRVGGVGTQANAQQLVLAGRLALA